MTIKNAICMHEEDYSLLWKHLEYEDWPEMPVDALGFMLKPAGFFVGNPALDIASTDSCDSHTA